MLRDYLPLSSAMLQADVGYAQPTQAVPERATLEDAAPVVMTDLTRVTAVICLPGDTVDEAHRRMILGEKPVLAASQRGLHRNEVMVRDVMTPQERLEVLSMSEVRAAKVGHIVSTLQKAGRQHAMVVDYDERGRQTVRGLFSTTQIARQLGVAIQTSEIARTFSEIESMLAR